MQFFDSRQAATQLEERVETGSVLLESYDLEQAILAAFPLQRYMSPFAHLNPVFYQGIDILRDEEAGAGFFIGVFDAAGKINRVPDHGHYFVARMPQVSRYYLLVVQAQADLEAAVV